MVGESRWKYNCRPLLPTVPNATMCSPLSEFTAHSALHCLPILPGNHRSGILGYLFLDIGIQSHEDRLAVDLNICLVIATRTGDDQGLAGRGWLRFLQGYPDYQFVVLNLRLHFTHSSCYIALCNHNLLCIGRPSVMLTVLDGMPLNRCKSRFFYYGRGSQTEARRIMPPHISLPL